MPGEESYTLEDLIEENSMLPGYITRMWENTTKLAKEKRNIYTMEARKEKLEEYWANFMENHRKIMKLDKKRESAYVKNNVFDITEASFLENVPLLLQEIDFMRNVNVPALIAAAVPQATSSVQPSVKLPKIELPTFSGNILEWESFRDQFQALVDSCNSLSNVQKLMYLTSHLTGEAADTLKNTQVTAENYQGAWKQLEDRYGNKRLLSRSHILSMLNVPPASKQSSSELKRLIDFFQQTVRSLRALGKPIESWDEWFVLLITQKLDDATRIDWETSLVNSLEEPSFQSVIKFLENRQQALQLIDNKNPDNNKLKLEYPNQQKGKKSSINVVGTSSKSSKQYKCPSCSGPHSLSSCAKFKSLSLSEKKEQAKKLRVCFNCLFPGHSVTTCRSKGRCSFCSAKHHSLIHGHSQLNSVSNVVSDNSNAPQANNQVQNNENTFLSNSLNAGSIISTVSSSRVVLLATARVKIYAPNGKFIVARALLDTGADACLISEWIVQTLNLRKEKTCVNISGVQGDKITTARAAVNFCIRPHNQENFSLNIPALVVEKLTNTIPPKKVFSSSWPHLEGLNLAGPEFHIRANVDLLLGVDLCRQLFLNKNIQGPPGTPSAHFTPLGWVLMGSTCNKTVSHELNVTINHVQSHSQVIDSLCKFWELEECCSTPILSPEDAECEMHFQKTHSRDATGRYVVRLPLKSQTKLGYSRSIALRLLFASEARMLKNPALSLKYIDFMQEYLGLGHMKESDVNDVNSSCYYIPHHAVSKSHDSEGKIRVVFNASQKTSNGNSLNSIMLSGPRLQSDLWLILTRWRFFQVVIATDIVKMYRQILVHEDDLHLQKILFRFKQSDPVKEFQLLTVTYGQTAAAFIALRVLQQLANDESHRFPLAAKIIRQNSYVDDFFLGSDSVAEAFELKSQLINILSAGGFSLAKWSSNVLDLCSEENASELEFSDKSEVNVLGVFWNSSSDNFFIRMNLPVNSSNYTKRTILSDVSKLFDPLGWFAPVLVYAKILIQDLWIAAVDSDELVPDSISIK